MGQFVAFRKLAEQTFIAVESPEKALSVRTPA